MSDQSESKLSINSWLEDELYQQYLHDPQTIDESWKPFFRENGAGNGSSQAAAPASVPRPSERRPAPSPTAPEPAADKQLIPMRGAAARIAENMNESLSGPVATSQRILPVTVIDENRRIINQYRELHGQGKISYTHLIGWAIVRAIEQNPTLNHAYVENNGEPYRWARQEVNLGLAVDVAGKDGARSLVVPNVKNANRMNFAEFLAAYDEIVLKARTGKLTVSDFQGTTISLTNPGTVGTVGSVPRLMPGQGAIIATGAIDYPAEYQAVTNEVRSMLGLSKVMTMTCTYDHRVIQGAESGRFLGRIHALLQGEDQFYEQIFADLRMPHRPVRWEPDRQSAFPSLAARSSEIAKEAAVLRQ